MYKLELNTSIPYNYSFYCPASNTALDAIRNVAYVVELTPSMKRGIHARTLMCDEFVDEKDGIEVDKKEVEVEINENIVSPIVSPKEENEVEEAEEPEVEVEVVEEASVKEKKANKKSTKKK